MLALDLRARQSLCERFLDRYERDSQVSDLQASYFARVSYIRIPEAARLRIAFVVAGIPLQLSSRARSSRQQMLLA